MPIYEYYCDRCQSRKSVLVLSSASGTAPACPRCKRTAMRKLVSPFATVRSEEARLEALTDPSSLGGIDESDPRSMARWMRKMSAGTGDDLGPEFDEVCARLEAGEDPEAIEKDLGDAPDGLEGPDSEP